MGVNNALKWSAARPLSEGTQAEDDFVAVTFVHEPLRQQPLYIVNQKTFFYTSSEMLRVITEGGGRKVEFVGNRSVP